MNPLEWIQYEFLGNTLLIWGLAVVVSLSAWAGLLLARRVLRNRFQALADRTESTALRVAAHGIGQCKAWFLLIVAVFIGSRPMAMPGSIDTLMVNVAIIALLVQGGIWATAALLQFLEVKRDKELEDNPGVVAAMDLMSFVARVGVWSIVLLAILDNLGVNITTLIAGLGVGGIAVALAAQNIVSDLFSALSIVLDKPFVVGDFLNVDDYAGNVEKVGIKTTRIRSLSGEQLIFSNTDLLSSRVRNYGRMFERRVVFSLGVTYQTPLDKLKRIPDILREAIEAQDRVRFDRAHFKSYGDFALIYEIVYYVLSSDFKQYMDIQQAINFLVHERFEGERIEFAYPTQTVFIARDEQAE